MNAILRRIRGYLYRHGYRPKSSSLLYSPSLDLHHQMVDARPAIRAAPSTTREHDTVDAPTDNPQ